MRGQTGLPVWAAGVLAGLFVPVVVPPHIADLCSEERPVDVVDLPLMPSGLGRASRPECRVWLMRKATGIVLILNGADAEEMIGLVALLDAERAVQLHEELADAEWVDVREDEQMRRAQAQWALFGAVDARSSARHDQAPKRASAARAVDTTSTQNM